MSLNPARDDMESPSKRFVVDGRVWLGLAAALVLCLGVGALYFLSNHFGAQSTSTKAGAGEARSYRTLSRTDLRQEPNATARVIVTLREGTTVSGTDAGTRDGTQWLAITAVDGTRGFAPKSSLRELAPAAAASQIAPGTRRLITSVTVNLRETPSLSGKILGVAEGGTRLVSDGSIQSEGEDWLRIPLDGQTTVFVMQRFTSADDDDSNSDGVDDAANVALGVRAFATQIVNVQATPMDTGRVIRALQLQEEVRVIGQTNAGRAWYVLRLSDGSQGFAPRDAIRIDPQASRWVYPDGTPAPGPNIPKGMTEPVNVKGKSGVTQQRSSQSSSNTPNSGGDVQAVPQTADPAQTTNAVAPAPEAATAPTTPETPSAPTP